MSLYQILLRWFIQNQYLFFLHCLVSLHPLYILFQLLNLICLLFTFFYIFNSFFYIFYLLSSQEYFRFSLSYLHSIQSILLIQLNQGLF